MNRQLAPVSRPYGVAGFGSAGRTRRGALFRWG